MEIDYSKKNKDYFGFSRLEIIPYFPNNLNKVLDVGCASGNFGKLLKDKFGCKVCGVEPNKIAAEIAKTKLDKIYNSIFDDSLDINGELFDCIFFNDVLEHLVDPLKSLQFAKQLLLPNGYIIASIPNIRHFEVIWELIIKRDFKYVEAGILDNTHLKFFTKKSILRLFDESGFKVEKIEGINSQVGRKFKIINLLLLNKIEDMKYIQFVIVARIKSE